MGQDVHTALERMREALKGRILHIGMKEAGDLLLARAETGEFWVMLFDSQGALPVMEMIKRYYPVEKEQPGDCLSFVGRSTDGETFFGVIALRKRLMSVSHMGRILKRAGVLMTKRELLRPKVLIVADRARLPLLADFCSALFGDKFTVVCSSDADAKNIFTGEKRYDG